MLISFKTAQLAKEKGFREPCLYYFSNDGQEKSFSEDGMYFYSCGEHGRLVLRPQQSELQRWLRNLFEIDITIMIVGFDSYSLDVHKGRNHKFRKEFYPQYKEDTYEQALEQGLQEALKLI